MKAITCPRSCRGTGCEPLPLVLLLMQLTAISTHLTNIYDWTIYCLVASVVSNSLRTHGLQSTRLLCPWDSPGKNNRVGCHFLLQGIFLTQGSNPHLLHWQVDSLPLCHQGNPLNLYELHLNSSPSDHILALIILRFQSILMKAVCCENYLN